MSFLDSRKQRILLNGQCSSRGFINAAVPQVPQFHKSAFSNLYKQSDRKSLIKLKTFCRRHFFVYINK